MTLHRYNLIETNFLLKQKKSSSKSNNLIEINSLLKQKKSSSKSNASSNIRNHHPQTEEILVKYMQSSSSKIRDTISKDKALDWIYPQVPSSKIGETGKWRSFLCGNCFEYTRGLQFRNKIRCLKMLIISNHSPLSDGERIGPVLCCCTPAKRLSCANSKTDRSKDIRKIIRNCTNLS